MTRAFSAEAVARPLGLNGTDSFRSRFAHVVARGLEHVGEAAAQLSRVGIEALLPAIPWSRIRGMRNMLAHEYFGVDRDLVLEVIRHKIPELRQAIEAALAQPGS